MSESFVDQFEKELFTKEERKLEDMIKWRKYYDEERACFLPPYDLNDPKNKSDMEKYHICHYAYWMVISTFNLCSKPCVEGIILKNLCYACAFAFENSKNEQMCSKCPIKWEPEGFCAIGEDRKSVV